MTNEQLGKQNKELKDKVDGAYDTLKQWENSYKDYEAEILQLKNYKSSTKVHITKQDTLIDKQRIMIEALVGELEGDFKTDHTFRLMDEANNMLNK